MSNLIVPAIIEQIQYDKISDDIYFLGKNVVLRFNVNLSKTGMNNERTHYHKEYQYSSKFSNEPSNLITIRRNFDFYFSIENIIKDENNKKEFIRIGVTEIMSLQFYLKEVIKWFTDKKYEKLYASKNDRVIMLGRVDNIVMTNLPMDKYLEFQAIVCDYENNTYPGVRMYISSETNYIDMSVDKLMGLYYLLTNINMYESAQLMINYLQRPEYGTNMFTFNSNNKQQYSESKYNNIQAKEGRMIRPKNPTLKDL